MFKNIPLKRTAAAIIIACALLVCAASGYSAPRSSSAAARAVRLILKHYELYESNPVHMDEASHLNALFRDVLTRRKRLSVNDQYEIYCKSINIYAESVCHKFDLEDSVDEYRAFMRSSIALSIAALTSTPEEALHYFELSKISLLENNMIYSHYAEIHYAALLLMEGLYLSEHNLLHHANKKSLLRTLSSCRTLNASQKKTFIEAFEALK